jgi:enoyl-CoA hydratase/carnithine racemase
MVGRALQEADALAARMAELAPLSVRAFKGLLRTAVVSSRSDAQALETAEFVRLWASGDHKEGLESLLDKRDPRFTGE